MATGQIKFGTDGWRALIAEDYTFDNVRACAQGVVNYLRRVGGASRGLVVGYDTRFASDRFAMAVAEVVSAGGISVYLSDRACPTPAVSHGIIDRRAAGGVVITASHNPASYNGFKYKPDYGGSASPEIIAELEQEIAAVQAAGPSSAGPSGGASIHTVDVTTPYLEQISRLVDLQTIRAMPLRIVVDSMYGAGIGLFTSLLRGGSATVAEIHGESNPAFPGFDQPEPIAHNLTALSEAVAGGGVDVGLATDGDADRIGVMDETGRFVTQLQTMALLALYFLEVRGERGPIIKSLTTTSMMFKLGKLYEVPVFETPVGFKYIGPAMMREHALIGGEESGGYGFRGHIPERDGVLSGLFILDMMARLGKRPSELIDYLYEKVGPHHYGRTDLNFDPKQRAAILKRVESGSPERLNGVAVVSRDTVDGVRYWLEDGSWCLVRFSGTEPLVRVYCETSSEARVDELLEDTRRLTGV